MISKSGKLRSLKRDLLKTYAESATNEFLVTMIDLDLDNNHFQNIALHNQPSILIRGILLYRCILMLMSSC